MTDRKQLRFDGGRLTPVATRRPPGEVLPPAPPPAALAPYREPAVSAAPPIIRINGEPVPRDPAVVSAAPPSIVGRWELTRYTPDRKPDATADVRVPALQALLTGLAFGSGMGLIAWGLGWSWRVPLVIMGLAVIGGWLWRLRVVDKLLWRIEAALRRDLSGDNYVGPPAPAHLFTVVDPAQARASASQITAADATTERRDALLAFLARCYTVGTSEAAHGVKAGGPDREQYLACRETLLDLGLAAWKNADRPRAGWVLTLSQVDAEAVIVRHVLN